MKLALVAIAAAFFGFGAAHAEDTTALLHKYRCYICHADKEPGAGPAFVDVAARYRRIPNAANVLAALIINGARSGGPWHMPPHPEVSKAEAVKMARYILSLKL